MKSISRLLFSVILFFTALCCLQAQETVATAASGATGNNGSVNYTVGQVVYSTKTSSSGTVTEGVQQPYEFYSIEGIDEEGISLDYKVYPNPSTTKVTLRITGRELKDLDYRLSGMNGQVIAKEKIGSNETTIPLDNLAAATYFLSIYSKDTLLKTFRIIKN
jgi:hypothetical protein